MDHRNLHAHGHSTTEVRIAIAEHYKRDTNYVWVFDIIGMVGLYYLVKDWTYGERIAIFAVALGFASGLRLFIDNSNRNWWLHRLNWDNAVREEEQRAQEAYDLEQMEKEDRRKAQLRGFTFPEDGED